MAVRILPKDEARVRFSYPALGTSTAWVLLVVLLALALPPASVRAIESSASYALTAEATLKGLTLRTPDDVLRLGLYSGVLVGPATVTLTPLAELPAPLPSSGRYRAVTPAWEIGSDGTVGDPRTPVSVQVPTTNLYRKLILMLTPGRTGWEKLERGRLNGDRVQAFLKRFPTTIVVVEDTQVVEGAASWYRSSRYPRGVASNDYPMGTTLQVTNLENGKRTRVTVVSTGPFVPGRVVDLTYGPFSEIANPGAGLIAKVRVERVGPAPAKGSDSGDAAPDTDAGGTPTALGGAPPAIQARAAIVLDQGSNATLYAKSADTARPIASITKIIAAAVFLDTKPNLDRVVSVASADAAECSCLRMAPGESATLRDFLGASLVGSANNATKTLRRSTGLSVEEFTARMRSKAAAWGATTAYFVEPTGLEWSNVASARDTARMLAGAFREHPLIRDFVQKPSYAFTTVGGVLHTIRTTNALLASSSLKLTGGKTGYLVEAGYTMVLRARDAAGHQVIAVVLGEPTSGARFTDADALLRWALSQHAWSS